MCWRTCIDLKENPDISEVLEDMHWSQRGLGWKMTKLYWNYLQYTSCEIIFKFFIWLPSYLLTSNVCEIFIFKFM
jgi:hypothetical protein